MVKSLLDRLGLGRKDEAVITPPDLSRLKIGSRATTPKVNLDVDDTPKDVDVTIWRDRDLQCLRAAWDALNAAPDDAIAIKDMRAAIHDLYGASGIYGGGALTRLSGSLQRLMKDESRIPANAALINLHVQACLATCHTDGKGSDDLASAVCDALEAETEKSLTPSDNDEWVVKD
jgi:hypothetical protein